MSQAPLRVAINGLSAHTGGGLTYLAEQIKGLAGPGTGLELTVYCTDALADACGELRGARFHRFPHLPFPLRMAIEQILLPVLTRKADVVYCPGNFAMFLRRGPQVVVFQNPNHFGSRARAVRANHYALLHRLRKSFEAAVARSSLRRATAAIAISESLLATIREDVPDSAQLHLLLSASPELPAGGARSSAEDEYVLAVANDYPHKDWDGLIGVFTSRDDLPLLRLVGKPRSRKRERQLAGLIATSANPDGVELIGSITDRAALAALYEGARCFVAHSRLEAFPLTPFEALSRGLPVLATDIPPHREVCGDAAAYYPVDRPGRLGDLISDPPPAGSPPSGLRRTWSDNASELAAILRSAAVVSR